MIDPYLPDVDIDINIENHLGYSVDAQKYPFILPFDPKIGKNRIGADYFERMALTYGADYQKNLPNTGLMNDMSALNSNGFDIEEVDPLIIDFYEKTSSFKIELKSEWDWKILPIYLNFKKELFDKIGQTILPVSNTSMQGGLHSSIETLDLNVS